MLSHRVEHSQRQATPPDSRGGLQTLVYQKMVAAYRFLFALEEKSVTHLYKLTIG